MERNEPSGEKQFKDVDDIRTSVSHLLQEALLTDVEFRVAVGTSAKVFHAHKLILACRSPILADRLYKEKDTSVIFESDVGPLGIEQMIRYIYLDGIDSYSALALKQGLEASLKYCIKPLENLCISYLLALEITGDNVYEVLDAANRIKHDGIRQRCLEAFTNDTETLLNSSALRHASLNTLVLIFQLPELNIEGEFRLLEAAIVWLQHNRSSSSRDKLLSCIDIMALDVDEFLALIEKFPTFFSDSEIVSILSNIRYFGSRGLPPFCVTQTTKRKFLKPKCKPNVISNLGVSNSATQISSFRMLNKSTEISPRDKHFFLDQKTASVQTSLHAMLEKSTEISEEEVYMFRSTESMTTGVSALDGTSQISKSEAFSFNRKQAVDREVQKTSTATSNGSIQRDERNRIHFEDQGNTEQASMKTNDTVSTSSKEDISDKTINIDEGKPECSGMSSTANKEETLKQLAVSSLSSEHPICQSLPPPEMQAHRRRENSPFPRTNEDKAIRDEFRAPEMTKRRRFCVQTLILIGNILFFALLCFGFLSYPVFLNSVLIVYFLTTTVLLYRLCVRSLSIETSILITKVLCFVNSVFVYLWACLTIYCVLRFGPSALFHFLSFEVLCTSALPQKQNSISE